LFGRSWRRCKNNIKIDLTNIRPESVDCIHGYGLLGTVCGKGCEILGPQKKRGEVSDSVKNY
jgi:hypothetical protein